MLHYVEVAPSPSLAPYIHHFRLLYGYQAVATPVPYFPDGMTDIVLNFKGDIRRTIKFTSTAAASFANCVSGATMNTRLITLTGDLDVISMTLTTIGTPALLHLPAAALSEHTVPFHTFWTPSFVQQLADLAALHPLERIQPLERLLLTQVDDRVLDPLINQLIQLFHQTGGRTSVKQLLPQLSLSERTLDRLFQRYVGLSPKRYLRLIRFNGALRHLRTRSTESLAHVALEMGYFDQAHFDHDLVAITGLPASLLLDTPTLGRILQAPG